jgi:hypothetical protein
MGFNSSGEAKMMNNPVVVIGMGNMGSVFSHAFLNKGYPVYPVLRGMDPKEIELELPNPALVLVALNEDELHSYLPKLGEKWRNSVGLLQNEILPRDWEMHSIPQPTVISVWFEKRKNMPVTPYFPTMAYGPQADIVIEALTEQDIPVARINESDQLLFELVRKNVWIITLQVAGLITRGTIGEVWQNHRSDCTEIAENVLDVQEALADKKLPRVRLIEQMRQDFEAQPGKSTSGRSAVGRLERAVQKADKYNLAVPRLRSILSTVTG